MTALHPTAKKQGNGFVAMITIRGARGRMVGSKTAERAHETALQAEIEARIVALQLALESPDAFKVA